MKSQGDIGIFGCIGRRLLNINVIKRHLLNALAGHFLKGNNPLA